MPRRSRLVVPEMPLHIIQRGINRAVCFQMDNDYLVYLDQLRHCASLADCAIHAYVLMSNHVHMLVTPHTENAPGRLMKGLGERYVRYFNRRHGRTGTLWEGRFRSCLVTDERYFLVCQRYIELNPVRAGMVLRPGDYQWSSFRANTCNTCSTFLTPHDCYIGLGRDEEIRQANYLALFEHAISEQDLTHLRSATNSNFRFDKSKNQAAPQLAS